MWSLHSRSVGRGWVIGLPFPHHVGQLHLVTGAPATALSPLLILRPLLRPPLLQLPGRLSSSGPLVPPAFMLQLNHSPETPWPLLLCRYILHPGQISGERMGWDGRGVCGHGLGCAKPSPWKNKERMTNACSFIQSFAHSFIRAFIPLCFVPGKCACL